MTQNVLLGNDLVINENDCNLSCEYCLTGQSNFKKEHEEKLIFKTPKRDLYAPSSPLGQRIHKIVDRVKTSFKTPFLKITGGEIFLIKDIIKLIPQLADTHEVLVIQTNGVLINEEHINTFKLYNNIVLQISLDSHLHFGNSYRVSKSSLHEKVVKKIENIIQAGLPTEVYCVINDRSICELHLFADWLNSFSSSLTFFPFPIRGPTSEQFKIKPDQIKFINDFIDKYDNWERILPPKAYFKRLKSFYEDKVRTFRCHVPRLVVSSFSDGVLTACPNIWFSDTGNILDDESWEETKEKVTNTGLYHTLTAKKPRLDACKGCFTPWDTLSMYFDDEISLDELCAAPTYAKPVIRELIKNLKDKYLSEQGEIHDSQ